MLNNLPRRTPRPGSPQPTINGRERANSAPPVVGMGSMLRERREAMGIALAEVEVATKIRQKYLAALESDEWNLLPGEVVGRGFLRNYTTFLGLEPNEMIERRRSVADPALAAALLNTSAGTVLPNVRQIDYRPKDLPLKDEPEGIEEASQINLRPFFTVLALFAVLFLLWWGLSRFGGQMVTGVTGMVRGVERSIAQARATATFTPAPPPTFTATPAQNAAGTGNEEPNSAQPTPTADLILLFQPTATPAPVEVAAEPTITATTQSAPTDTPLPPTPTPTETPLADIVATETPTEVPTETPIPAPPAVAAAACPDSRAVLASPGANQVVAGAVQITGRAVHEIFQSYKLEFADVSGTFNYFDGATSQVDNGLLGTFSSTAVPNGNYTILLTVIDQTGNYNVCSVAVVVQN